jgi:hypothetical protein
MKTFKTILSEPFDLSKFNPISASEDVTIMKPNGGLWCSDADEDGRTPWHSFSGFGLYEYDVDFEDDACVLVIDSKGDYLSILESYSHVVHSNENDELVSLLESSGADKSILSLLGYDKTRLDFVAVAEDFDALYLTLDGLRELGRPSFNSDDATTNFHGWDVPTLLVFNIEKVSVCPSKRVGTEQH